MICRNKLSVAHRLLREDGYEHVIRAENISDSVFKVFFVCNGKKNAKLGMIVGKKTISGASGRNHIKRIIREAFRQHRIKQHNLDIVVLVKRHFPPEYSKQTENLNILFNRIEKRCADF